MSGHSKWATIHRAKGVKDIARGQLFSKLARAITIAAKTGGGPSPDSNLKLRYAIDKGREANMPKENIERAISKAAGGEVLDEVVYEGFGPEGIQVMVEVATDNRNRTGQEIKNLFEKSGGRFGGPGSVAFNFDPKGLIVIKKMEDQEAQVLHLIDAGVEDFEIVDDVVEVYVPANELFAMVGKLQTFNFEVTSSELIQKPKLMQKVEDPDKEQKVMAFLDTLNDHEDVQKVHTNLE